MSREFFQPNNLGFPPGGRELARARAHVVMTCRSPAKCKAAEKDIRGSIAGHEPKLTLMTLDLASLASVEAFADDFKARGLPLHVLMLSAGIMKSPGADFTGKPMTYGFEKTADGFEMHIGTNHIGHFYLTALLDEQLAASAPARVVVTSSAAERGSWAEGMRFDLWQPADMPEDYEDGLAYGQSKLANVLFARELAARKEGSGITAYALHPGIINTELGRYMTPHLQEEAESKGWVAGQLNRALNGFFSLACFDPPGGALTQLHLATADAKTLHNGGYYEPIGRHRQPQHPQGGNDTLAKELWSQTEAAIARVRG